MFDLYRVHNEQQPDFDNAIVMFEQNKDATFIVCDDFIARTVSNVPSYVDVVLSSYDSNAGNLCTKKG